jgi:hypothetical protein
MVGHKFKNGTAKTALMRCASNSELPRRASAIVRKRLGCQLVEFARGCILLDLPIPRVTIEISEPPPEFS